MIEGAYHVSREESEAMVPTRTAADPTFAVLLKADPQVAHSYQAAEGATFAV